MSHLKRPASHRKFQVNPRFELKIGTFVNDDLEISPPQTSRNPDSTIKHLDFDPKKPKITQKFDAASYPEEVVAIHTYGYAVAHKRYSENICESYEKQWDDDERLRKCKSARLRKPVDPIRRRKDQHVLERIIQDSVKRERTSRSFPQGNNSVGRMPLPPEERQSGRNSQRFFYYG